MIRQVHVAALDRVHQLGEGVAGLLVILASVSEFFAGRMMFTGLAQLQGQL